MLRIGNCRKYTCSPYTPGRIGFGLSVSKPISHDSLIGDAKELTTELRAHTVVTLAHQRDSAFKSGVDASVQAQTLFINVPGRWLISMKIVSAPSIQNRHGKSPAACGQSQLV